MDLEKIKELTNLVDYTERLKMIVEDNGTLKLKEHCVKVTTKKRAQELCDELNEAIAPIVNRYKAELRKALAQCAKG